MRRPRRAITDEEAERIHADFKSGISKRAIAAKYDRHQVTIAQVLQREYAKTQALIGPNAPPPDPPIRYVSIPRTGGRRSLWFKVITAVRANWAAAGFAFEGRCLPPGRRVPEDVVFLEGQDPEFAIAIEHAGPDRAAGRQHMHDGSGQARFPTIYILWRCSRESLAWRELARSTAIDNTWAIDLGPIAERALSPAAARADVELVERLQTAGELIMGCVREQLAKFQQHEHAFLFGILHDPLGALIVSAIEKSPIRRPPAREIEARIVPNDEEKSG